MWPSNFVIIAVETRGLFHYRDLQKKLRCTDSSLDNKHVKTLGFSDISVDHDLSFAVSQYVRSLKPRPFLTSLRIITWRFNRSPPHPMGADPNRRTMSFSY